jgi:uncharacterized protein DUF5666
VGSTTTFTLANGAAATLASVLVGDQIEAWGYYDTTMTGLNADFVVIHPVVLPIYVEGTITALGTGSVTVHRDNGQTATYGTTGATTYAYEGHGAASVADLAVGQSVDLTLTPAAPQMIVKLAIDVESLYGTVTAVTGSTISISTSSGARSVDVGSTTTFTLANGAAATLASVLVGDQIEAVGFILSGSATTVQAISVRIGSFL